MKSEDILKAKVYLYCALPLLEEVAKDSPKISSMIKKWNCVVQIDVKDKDLASYLQFFGGTLKVLKGKHEKPIITITFKDAKSLNDTFSGAKMSIPKIKGIWHIILLIKTMKLLNSLKILLPELEVKDYEEKKLKVKMLLYMVAFAMDEMSEEDDYIRKLISGSQDKIIQFNIGDGPSAYIRIDEQIIEANKGEYDERPYLLLDFKNIDSAYDIFTSKVSALDAIGKQLVLIKGSPEYALRISNLMKRVGEFMKEK